MFTVNATPQSIQPGWGITESANSRNRMDFSVFLAAGTGRLVNDDVIQLTEDGTVIFGGLVDNPGESGFGGMSSTNAIVQKLSAVDFNVYPARITVGTDTDRPAESLAARLGWIAGLMSAQGVTLDGGQVTGPTLPAASYSADRYLVDVLNETVSLASGTGSTSWVWNVDYTKVLSGVEIDTGNPAPFNIADGDGTVVGDITVEQPRPSNYGNYIVVLGGSGTHDVADAFTGDGVTSSFLLTYTLALAYGYVTVDGVLETLAVQGTGFDAAATWLYYTSDNTIRRVVTAGPPGIGAAISITYAGQFPKRVFSDGGVADANRVIKTWRTRT